MRVLVVDTETTGLSPGTDRLIEVGALLQHVDEDAGVVVELAALSLLVNPQMCVPHDVSTLTGLQSEQVSLGLGEAQALGLLAGAMAAADVVIAWNASFDRTMIEAAAARAGVSLPSTPWRCALQAARLAHPEWPRHRLSDALKALGLSGVNNTHRALDDARAAFAVWWRVSQDARGTSSSQPATTRRASTSQRSASPSSAPRLPLWRRLFA